MEITEMLLVTENWKGAETNALMNFRDFLRFIDMEGLDTQIELAEMMNELGRTLGQETEWVETYSAANKSISARYCSSQKQLVNFLHGSYNSTDQEVRFSRDLCSEVCLKKLKALGMDLRGRICGMGLHYEKLDMTFMQGQVLHNFNGNDYRVMEKFSRDNLLLQDVDSGNFTVALGVKGYNRHPMEEAYAEGNSEAGIEWENGVYLGNMPSAIDFHYLRNIYGEEKKIGSLTEYRNMLLERFQFYGRISKDERASEAMKDAAVNLLYQEFGTGKRDLFLEKLQDGIYDGEFSKGKSDRKMGNYKKR